MRTEPTTGAAELPESLRVPLDSLHADAGYLCGRLLDGSLTQEQVVTSIRRRIDAAKTAALAGVQPATSHVEALSAAQAGVLADDAVDLLRKYKKLCMEIGQGDSHHLGCIDAVLAAAPHPPAQVSYDERAALALFQSAAAGSDKPAGILRGIRAVIASWESRPDDAAWLVEILEREILARSKE